MHKPSHLHPSDVQGVVRLAADATIGTTDLVEAMHHAIVTGQIRPSAEPQGRMCGISGLVYRNIRAVTRLVGGATDVVMEQAAPWFETPAPTQTRESVLAALNGVVGDHLEQSRNPLAISMHLRRNGERLALDRAALAAAIPEPTGKLLVLVHGLCMNDLQWLRRDHDHGAALARDFGFTPLYLHYNSGRHTSHNGRALAELLESLVAQWPQPVEELTLLTHSMGGLVARSACHYAAQAEQRWLQLLRTLVFLGTPHHGAPLERNGNWASMLLQTAPYAGPMARLGRLRSAGITDLRHGNLLDEDWEGLDRFDHVHDTRATVPLPAHVRCYAMAATTGKTRSDLPDLLLGDGLVPVSSALGHHANGARVLAIPPAQQWVGYDMHHMDLLHHPAVYAQLSEWLAA